MSDQHTPSFPDLFAVTVGGPAVPADAVSLPPRFAHVRRLGRGGMGAVHLARDAALGRDVAVKVLLTGDADAADLARFRDEARAVAQLQHPGIVQVFDVGDHDGRPYIALEFCPGGSLDAVLAKNPLPPRAAAELTAAVAGAVHAAHEAGILHRDLKPGNVLIDGAGRPKVADFGLAKRLGERGATRTGNVVGTPAYMPPEQAAGRTDLDARADVYSLGAILYECLTGRPPFRAATPFDTLVLVMTLDPTPPRALNPSVPADLETIALKCLHKKPSGRYASARELADDLGRYLRGEAITARPPGVVERAARWVSRNALAAATLLAAALGLGAAASLYFMYRANESADLAKEAAGRAEMAADIADRERGRADVQSAAARKAEGEARTAEAEAVSLRAEAADLRERAERMAYARQVRLVQDAMAANRVAEALVLLEETPSYLRGWEYRYLRDRLRGRQLILPGRTTDFATAAAWAGDGSRLFVSDGDNVRVRDAATTAEVATLPLGGDRCERLACSPDGRHLLSGHASGTAAVRDARTGAVVRTHPKPGRSVGAVLWSPDGALYAVLAEDGTVVVHDAADGSVVRAAPLPVKLGRLLAFSPDGKHLAAAGTEEVRVLDARTGAEVPARRAAVREASCVAWSPDGSRLVVGDAAGVARVFDRAGKPVFDVKGHGDRVVVAAWSPDGSLLLTGIRSGVIRASDGNTGVTLPPWPRFVGLDILEFSPDGRRLLAARLDYAARVETWDVSRAAAFAVLRGHTRQVTAVGWTPDGAHAWTAGRDGAFLEWSPSGAAKRLFSVAGIQGISSAVRSPDGSRVAAGDGTSVRVVEASTGKQLAALPRRRAAYTAAAWNPDGNKLVAADFDGGADVFDGAGKSLHRFSVPGYGTAAAWRPDGSRFVLASLDESAVFDASGKTLFRLGGKQSSYRVARWNRDGSRLLTADTPTMTASLRDGDSGATLAVLSGHSGSILCGDWLPDGSRIVTASADSTVRVWDAVSGAELFRLLTERPTLRVAWNPDGSRFVRTEDGNDAYVHDAPDAVTAITVGGHAGAVESAVFSADGKTLFAWDASGRRLAWDAVTGRPVESAAVAERPPPGVAVSPDGLLRAVPRGRFVDVFDRRKPPPEEWPLPSAADRRRHHLSQADLAARAGRAFAEAFHVGRVLLDEPGNAELRARHAAARKRAG